ELTEDHRVPLRDVEAERDLPGSTMVVPRTERHVETPFAIGEACQVVADVRWHFPNIEHRSEPFLLITRTARIFTAAFFGRGRPSGEYRRIRRGSQQMARFCSRNFSGPSYSYGRRLPGLRSGASPCD